MFLAHFPPLHGPGSACPDVVVPPDFFLGGGSTRAVSVDRCDVKGLWSNQMPACSFGLGGDIQQTVAVYLVLAVAADAELA